MSDISWGKALDKTVIEIQEMMIDRHRKYGAGNIQRHGIEGILVRLDDKIERIANSKGDFKDESYRDAWTDVVGYGLIALMWLDGTWPGSPHAVKATVQTKPLTGASSVKKMDLLTQPPDPWIPSQKPAQQSGSSEQDRDAGCSDSGLIRCSDHEDCWVHR